MHETNRQHHSVDALLFCHDWLSDGTTISSCTAVVPLSTTETTEPPTESVPETMATTTIQGPSYPQETVSAPASMEMPAEVRVQAEDCKLSTLFTVENERSGYTGSGYVAGLSGDLQNTLLFQVSVPSSQHYDISVVMAADADATCLMTVEGTPYNLLTIPGTGKFVQATVQGVYLEAGTQHHYHSAGKWRCTH